MIESSAILKSINIPSIVFPISSMASGVINLLLSLIPFTILMYFFGFQLGWVTLLVLPALVLFGLFTLGICLFMCAINVYFRDIGILWSSLTPAMFYFTPIVYAPELVPEQYRWALKFNPIYHFMEIFRDILYYNQLPSGKALAITGGLTVIALILGSWTFRKLERGFISNY
ncbi:MAG: ABC transporter permease [Bacteroidota bacterium]